MARSILVIGPRDFRIIGLLIVTPRIKRIVHEQRVGGLGGDRCPQSANHQINSCTASATAADHRHYAQSSLVLANSHDSRKWR